MLLVNGKGTELDNFASSLPLQINNCGVNINDPVYNPMTVGFEIYRPSGRLDYQILYMWLGQSEYLVDGIYRRLEPGDMLLYKPGDVQRYAYSSDKPVECRWVHFTGTEVEHLLAYYGVFQQPICHIGVSNTVKALFERMSDEIERKQPHHADLCNSLFNELLVTIARRATVRSDGECKKKQKLESQLAGILAYMNESYQQQQTVSDYAEQCGLSDHYFIGVFKEFTGMSPYAYLTRLRIDHAKELLRCNGASITDIAHMCGFSNPLYFSRAFAKKTGVSPSEYRASPELWKVFG